MIHSEQPKQLHSETFSPKKGREAVEMLDSTFWPINRMCACVRMHAHTHKHKTLHRTKAMAPNPFVLVCLVFTCFHSICSLSISLLLEADEISCLSAPFFSL